MFLKKKNAVRDDLTMIFLLCICTHTYFIAKERQIYIPVISDYL